VATSSHDEYDVLLRGVWLIQFVFEGLMVYFNEEVDTELKGKIMISTMLENIQLYESMFEAIHKISEAINTK
jgi:hypothetical protein